MKITILTYGSRGDVQPFLPLSVGLMARGHQVSLAAPSRFKDLVEYWGIRFVPLAGEPEDLSRRLNDSGQNFIRMAGEMMEHALEIAKDVLDQTEEACRDAELIIHSFAHVVGAHTLACEKRIPDIHIQTFPMFTPTGDYPNVTLPDLKVPVLNRFTHILSQKITWWGARFGFERVRRRAGLPRRTLYSPFDAHPARPPMPVLCAWSPSLIPPSSDWPPHVYVTGWYFFDSTQDYVPPAELQAFLEAGEPPVCISFGSMVHRNQEQIDHVVRQSLVQTHTRGVFLSGWSRLRLTSSDRILYLDAAPHDWLLPRCKMIIHHGGAGTTSAGVRAGIPNIVVPFTADQPFWGRRVYQIGAGPAPIPVKKLSVEKLTQAIAYAGSQASRERARLIGQVIRGEDGVARAIHLIESFSNTFHTQD